MFVGRAALASGMLCFGSKVECYLHLSETVVDDDSEGRKRWPAQEEVPPGLRAVPLPHRSWLAAAVLLLWERMRQQLAVAVGGPVSC